MLPGWASAQKRSAQATAMSAWPMTTPNHQGVESAAHALAAERLLGLLERVRRLAVGEQVAELALVVRADGLVEGHGGMSGAECLVDVLHRQAGRLGELLLRRLATELDLEPTRCASWPDWPPENRDRHLLAFC